MVSRRRDLTRRRDRKPAYLPAVSTILASLHPSFKAVDCGHCQSDREPVWPSGKALGWEAEGPWFDPLRLSSLSSSKMVVYGHCLVTLPIQLM